MNNKYIGCVTVDIELTSITNLISDIRIGDTGSAILITGTGTYMAGVSEDKIQNEINITEDDHDGCYFIYSNCNCCCYCLLQVRVIANSISRVQKFAGSLVGGDFTVNPITVKWQDEIGNMSDSLNQMYDSNKGIISNIKEHFSSMDEASIKIREAAQNTTELSSNIMEAITQLSGNVTDISDMSDRQDIIVRDLNDVVSKFTLD